MKRLKSKLLAMEPNTQTYEEMYSGRLVYRDPAHPDRLPMPDYNPTYYRENVGFEITATHKLAQDKPTVPIIIPYDRIL